ncbi:hypothetical protein P691DRAFT_765776, partial [Macrolepiota fuliginosa MF-IS2]
NAPPPRGPSSTTAPPPRGPSSKKAPPAVPRAVRQPTEPTSPKTGPTLPPPECQTPPSSPFPQVNTPNNKVIPLITFPSPHPRSNKRPASPALSDEPASTAVAAPPHPPSPSPLKAGPPKPKRARLTQPPSIKPADRPLPSTTQRQPQLRPSSSRRSRQSPPLPDSPSSDPSPPLAKSKGKRKGNGKANASSRSDRLPAPPKWRVVNEPTSSRRSVDQISAEFGEVAPFPMLQMIPQLFSLINPDNTETNKALRCLNCIRESRPCIRTFDKVKCQGCETRKASHCSFSLPAPLYQFQASRARVVASTSQTYLAERLRNLTTLHTALTLHDANRDLLFSQYTSQVMSFIHDINQARVYHQNDFQFWTDSGLFASDEEAKEIFTALDIFTETVTSDPVPNLDREEQLAIEEVYRLHGHAINLFHHVHAYEPADWPELGEGFEDDVSDLVDCE